MNRAVTADGGNISGTKVLIDSSYRWHVWEMNGTECYFSGWCVLGKDTFTGTQAAQCLAEGLNACTSREEERELVANLMGNFAFVLMRSNDVIAAVDKIRSIPLFFCSQDGFVISDSATRLRSTVGLTEWNADGVDEFQLAGYVTGRETLVVGLEQLQAGEMVRLESINCIPEFTRYYTFTYSETEERSECEWVEAVKVATENTFQQYIKKLDGRPVWIPLSGGLDSRLILAMFVQSGYKDVTTFSYGLKGNRDAAVAREVAQALSVEWIEVPYDHRNIAALHSGPEVVRSFEYAHGLSSAPFQTETYALAMLSGRIPEGAVIVNGQSGDFITGGHIPAALEDTSEEFPSLVTAAILDKHYSLWSDLKTPARMEKMARRVERLLSEQDAVLDSQGAASAIECWEWQERQSKYVVNGVRDYESMGLNWLMPLWSDQYLALWRQVPWHLKVGQRLYKRYLLEVNPAGVFSCEWPEPPVVPTYMPLLSKGVTLASILLGKSSAQMKQKFLRYWMEKGPLLAFLSYREYMQRSKYHRNLVSYRSHEMLRNLGVPAEMFSERY